MKLFLNSHAPRRGYTIKKTQAGERIYMYLNTLLFDLSDPKIGHGSVVQDQVASTYLQSLTQ